MSAESLSKPFCWGYWFYMGRSNSLNKEVKPPTVDDEDSDESENDEKEGDSGALVAAFVIGSVVGAAVLFTMETVDAQRQRKNAQSAGR
jgi:hypothetical protein